MNLVLSFVHPGRKPRVLGPFESVCLDRESLRVDGNPHPVAVHRDHQWVFEEERYFRLDASQPVVVRFQGTGQRSRTFGPFQRFSLVDGVAYVDDRVLAFMEQQTGVWFSYDDGRHWPQLVINEAPASSRIALVALTIGMTPWLSGEVSEPVALDLAAVPATARAAARARRCVAPYRLHASWTRTRMLADAAARHVDHARTLVRHARALRSSKALSRA